MRWFLFLCRGHIDVYASGGSCAVDSVDFVGTCARCRDHLYGVVRFVPGLDCASTMRILVSGTFVTCCAVPMVRAGVGGVGLSS